jgi:hypothetical protein
VVPKRVKMSLPASIHPYIHIHTTHTSIHPYIHTSIHSHIHTSIHPFIHTSVHAYIHTYIHPYILLFCWFDFSRPQN